MSQPAEVLHTTEASYGKVFSRSQKMQARIASQRGFDNNVPLLPHQQGRDDMSNDNYRPEKETFGGSHIPQRSARMLNKARSIKTFNQNMANINKNRIQDQPPPPPPRISEESNTSQGSPRQHHPHQPPPPHGSPYGVPQFANQTQAAMFEEFQDRELQKLREINALQKQREEEERLIREEEASQRMRELRLMRDNRLLVEREEEKLREKRRREEEARIREEQEQLRLEEERREQERVAREEEAKLQELMTKQKKAAKKKKLQDEIDLLLDEEDLMEALLEQKQLILNGQLNEGDMANAILRLQNLERYLQQRQQGISPTPARRVSQGPYSHTQPPPPKVTPKRNPTVKEIANFTDAEIAQAIEDTRSSLVDFDTKTEAELLELYQVLTNLETEAARRGNGNAASFTKKIMESGKRELQYKIQEERNGADVQRRIEEEKRARLEAEREKEEQMSEWTRAQQLKQEKMQEMLLKEAQLKEAQRLQKEKELQRAQEMRQRLIDEERRFDEEDRRRKEQQDKQLLQEKEELVQKLQHKLDAEEKLRAKQDEYQKAKELQLQQERDLAERQRLLEKKQRLQEEKRRAQEERNGNRRETELLEQKKGAALLLKEKENLITQLQKKIEEEERLKAKKENFKRTNSLKRQESLRRQEAEKAEALKRRESLERQESLKALKKQVSFNSSVKVGVFQQQQQNKEANKPVNFTSDSESDSDEDNNKPKAQYVSNGLGGAAHYSYRDGHKEADQTNDLYMQQRNGLRPVNPDCYNFQRRKSRNAFDTDENSNDRDSEELRSAKFNYSNLGDDPAQRKKKHSFNASYDNPMANKGSKPPPPPPKTTSPTNKPKQSPPSVLSRWPPAQNM